MHAMSFKGKRGGGVADVIEKSSSSFIGWNFHLHTDENGSISASEASRFFSNATRVDEEKKLVRRVANVAASAPGSLCCSDLSRLDSASTEYDLCRRRKKLLIWA